jgi:hypothetical protein
MAAAIVTRTMNIAAEVAEFIEAAPSSEGALLCEAEPQCVGGARMLPIIVVVRASPIVVVDADGKHN